MTKKITRLMLISFCFLTIFSHYAVAGTIKGSKHDFSSAGVGTFGTPFGGNFNANGAQITEICVFCHTPHGSSADSTNGLNTVLWNRIKTEQQGAAGYTLYSSSTFTKSENPTGLSLMCLSCHDGVTSIAVGTLLNAPGSGNPEVTAIGSNYSAIGTLYYYDPDYPALAGVGANIGNLSPGSPFNAYAIDLSNDHPVSFPWPSGYADLKAPGSIDSRLRLFGGSAYRMECSTCHNVHDNTDPPFLVMKNDNSDMCLACHNK